MVSPETAAPNVPGHILNKLLQTCPVDTLTFGASSLSLYLGRRTGSGTPYNVVAETWEADTRGLPMALLASGSIPAASVTSDGWYSANYDAASRHVRVHLHAFLGGLTLAVVQK